MYFVMLIHCTVAILCGVCKTESGIYIIYNNSKVCHICESKEYYEKNHIKKNKFYKGTNLDPKTFS